MFSQALSTFTAAKNSVCQPFPHCFLKQQIFTNSKRLTVTQIFIIISFSRVSTFGQAEKHLKKIRVRNRILFLFPIFWMEFSLGKQAKTGRYCNFFDNMG